MGNAKLVGHELVGVLAVGFTEVFVEFDAVADGKDCVGAINGNEHDVGQVLRFDHQQPQRKEQNEANGD